MTASTSFTGSTPAPWAPMREFALGRTVAPTAPRAPAALQGDFPGNLSDARARVELAARARQTDAAARAMTRRGRRPKYACGNGRERKQKAERYK
jgi:hypothetical protein